jgi:hypothetical protein
MVGSSDHEESYDEQSMLSEEEDDAERINESTALMQQSKATRGYSSV